jgi:hypothetical protein
MGCFNIFSPWFSCFLFSIFFLYMLKILVLYFLFYLWFSFFTMFVKNISLLFVLSFYSKWLFNKFGGLSFFVNLVSCSSFCNFCCLSSF